MLKTRLLSLAAALVLLVSCLTGVATVTVSAASDPDFTFGNGKMSEEVLRNYLSRAVTFMGLCAEGGKTLDNLTIDEDIRFLLRTGTKFVSRAALFAWSCTAASEVEKHYEYAKTNAAKVHAADKEIILQAFVAEIVRKSYIQNIKVPAWVFEAFGEKPEDRNFIFEDIINQSSGPNYWGTNAGYPDWSRPEAQRWYYYCIRRYIDCGYESIHMQEASYDEAAKRYDPEDLAACDKVLTMARQYAKQKARRGIVLFHNFFPMSGKGSKIGDRLVFDINGNGLVPNESQYNEETGAYECIIATDGLTWFGRSQGGEHPLGFTCETVPTLLEFDNYGQQSKLNENNGPSNFGTWGYDDISWFATQPEAYRNEFLKYLNNLVKTKHLSKKGEQQYYILYPARRCLTASPNDPVIKYTPGKSFNVDFLLDYATFDEYKIEYVASVKGNYYNVSTIGYYKANRNSDGCPNGGNQEDTIREIFLGKNAKEDAKWNTVVLPEKYVSTAKTTTKKATTTTKATEKTTAANKTTADAVTTTTTAADVSDDAPDVSDDVSGDVSTDVSSDAVPDTDVSADDTSSVESGDDVSDSTGADPTGSPLVWVLVAGGVIVAAGAVVAVILVLKKKGASK